MKALLQRVSAVAVSVDGRRVASSGHGLCVFVGVADGDTEADAESLARRAVGLRIFEDGEGKMNRSLAEVGGQMLVVSQFTLLADTRKGRRPSFHGAAAPAGASGLVDSFAGSVRAAGVEVAAGRFGEYMEVELTADGPVTIMLDSREKRDA